MSSYKAKFFEELYKNLKSLEGKLTTDGKGNLTKSLKNTALFARALHDTFGDAGDVAGIMLMSCGCDYSPIDES